MNAPPIAKETGTYEFALRLPDFVRLPLTTRVLDELIAMLNHADALLRELETEEASPLLWIEPHVRQVYREVDALIGRFSE